MSWLPKHDDNARRPRSMYACTWRSPLLCSATARFCPGFWRSDILWQYLTGPVNSGKSARHRAGDSVAERKTSSSPESIRAPSSRAISIPVSGARSQNISGFSLWQGLIVTTPEINWRGRIEAAAAHRWCRAQL